MDLTREDLIVIEGALEQNIRNIKEQIKDGQRRGNMGATYLDIALNATEETYRKIVAGR